MNDLTDALRKMRAPTGDRALAALVEAMLDLLSEAETHATRSLAAGVLGDIGDERAVDALARALDDPHVIVRYTAAEVLLKVGAVTAVRALLDDEDAGIRRMVLFRLVDDDLVEGMSATAFTPFLDDRDPSVRQRAIAALRATSDPDAFPHLLDHLHDADSRVALAAAEALGAAGNPNAADALYRLAADETAYYQLRAAAAAALARVAGPDATPRLLSLLTDPDVYIRGRVIEAIPAVTGAAEADLLLQAADSHRDLVRPVADALARSGAAVEGAMIDALSHLRSWVRSLAVEVLGETGSRAAVEPLLRVLREDAPEVRTLAANALGQIGDPAAVDGLTAALDDDNWLTGMAAASALRRINTPAALAALAAWRSDRDL